MPTRLRFTLAGPATEHPFVYARELQAKVLQWFQRADPAVSARLHDPRESKPYSLSPLRSMGDPEGEGTHQFHLCLLEDRLPRLLFGVLSPGEEVRLGAQRFQLAEVTVCGSDTWEHLRFGGEAAWPVTVRFHSPTARRSAGKPQKQDLYPSARFCWESWLRQWRLAQPELPIPDEVVAWSDRHVAVWAYQLQTEAPVPLVKAGKEGSASPGASAKGAGSFVGFTGWARYQLLDADTVPSELRQCLAALLRLAPYCGTGGETQCGMGWTEVCEAGGRDRSGNPRHPRGAGKGK